MIADVWDADTRGKALALFTLAPFAGPALGPIVSGFINVSGTPWRWVFWVQTIFAGVCLLVTAVTLPETYTSVLGFPSISLPSGTDNVAIQSRYFGEAC